MRYEIKQKPSKVYAKTTVMFENDPEKRIEVIDGVFSDQFEIPSENDRCIAVGTTPIYKNPLQFIKKEYGELYNRDGLHMYKIISFDDICKVVPTTNNDKEMELTIMIENM